MDFLTKNLPLILIAMIVFSLAAIYVVDNLNKSKEDQIKELEKWLRYLVFEAEKYFGSQTGQLKLAYVYNLAVKQFPWIAKYMTFEEFDQKYVKAALEWLNKQLESNPAILELFNTQIDI